MKTIYRFYFDGEFVTNISGVTLAYNNEDATERVINYLKNQFSDIAEINCVTEGEGQNLWVWCIDEDDDFNDAEPETIAVNYQ